MGRAPCCDKANVKKGPWSPEEDATLKAYIEQYGTGGNWIALPQKVGLKRCGKSCRLRWLNYLRPNIKHGGFSEEEDNIICSLYISIGSRWSIIAAQLPGRTDNDIKNYWNTRLKKKLLGRRKQCISNRQSSMIQDPKDANDGEDSSFSQALTSSALERLQLHMQLQSLQNPISFYNNPALWPRSHPLQEIMTQSPNPLMQQGQKANFYEPQDFPGNPEADVNGLLDSYIVHRAGGGEQSNASVQPVLNFNAELEEFLNNKEDQVAEFDSFKEMNGCKESLIWWANEFDTKSGSSNSWDSTTSVLQSEGMFQDQYELGYNLE